MSAYDKAADVLAHTRLGDTWKTILVGDFEVSYPVVVEIGGLERECLCGCDEFRMGPEGVLMACNGCGLAWNTIDDPPPPKIEEITDW